eukprot:CAMPEP_0174732748 /NCGR_PEP_ID=MMETSP1094-20130205/59973_1 /TAXON_ID=156173 /ORGANISM="Chrysochromulina brevifilum, Strain UTEX LB 985" /LENGTH=41 /DNA_ID= /DNA_START= /DNA_END= /DNA_ORIENTATION=
MADSGATDVGAASQSTANSSGLVVEGIRLVTSTAMCSSSLP